MTMSDTLEGEKVIREGKMNISYVNEHRIHFDFSHTHIDVEGVRLLQKVAEETQLASKIKSMFEGEVINQTEKRKVWHTKLR